MPDKQTFSLGMPESPLVSERYSTNSRHARAEQGYVYIPAWLQRWLQRPILKCQRLIIIRVICEGTEPIFGTKNRRWGRTWKYFSQPVNYSGQPGRWLQQELLVNDLIFKRHKQPSKISKPSSCRIRGCWWHDFTAERYNTNKAII